MENSTFYFILVILIIFLICFYIYQIMNYYYELNLINNEYNKIKPDEFLKL
jgi:hypothetical protein